MLYDFTINNVFEEILNGEIEFFYDSNKLEYDTINNTHPDFTQDTNGNWVYSVQINSIQPIRAIKDITNITFDLFPEMTGDINIRFKYSTDNISYNGTYLDITEQNLELLSNKYQLWIMFEITYIIEEEPTEDIILPISKIFITGTRNIDPIFEATTIAPGDLRVFTAQDTYKAFNITDYELFLASGNPDDLEIFFRFTQTQGRVWSNWVKLTAANLQRADIIRIKFIDFQFGFKNNGSTPIELYDLELIGDFQNVTGNYVKLGRYGLKTQCNPLANGDDCDGCDDNGNSTNNGGGSSCAPCSESFTPWNVDCGSLCNLNENVDNLNDMNLMLPLIERQQELNEYAEARSHWKFDYFYTDPDKKGIDMVLYENQLANVIMKRQMKVIVPDNQFPVDTISFSGFGLDLIVQFEVHILRSTFKKVFGVESKPRKGDYMYLCDTNLIYEVEQVIDRKDFMNASFFWRIILKKYEQKASRRFANTTDGQEAKDFTESIVKYTTLSDLFSDDNAVEIEKNNLEKQLHDNSEVNESQQSTDLFDGVYHLYEDFNKKLLRTQEQLWNASNNFSNFQYKIPHKTNNSKMVLYKYKDNSVDKIDNRAISMWCKFEDYEFNPAKYNNHEYLLLSNYDVDNELGYKLVLKRGVLELNINDKVYQLNVNLLNDMWYCFYIGINQEKEELEMSVYRRLSEDGRLLTNSNLIKEFGKTHKLDLFKFMHDESLYIGGMTISNNGTSNNAHLGNNNSYYMTNIVVWKEPIVKSKRSAILSQEKMKDGHLVIIADDAKKPIDLPFYGNI